MLPKLTCTYAFRCIYIVNNSITYWRANIKLHMPTNSTVSRYHINSCITFIRGAYFSKFSPWNIKETHSCNTEDSLIAQKRVVFFTLFGAVLFHMKQGTNWTIFTQLLIKPFPMEGGRRHFSTAPQKKNPQCCRISASHKCILRTCLCIIGILHYVGFRFRNATENQSPTPP